MFQLPISYWAHRFFDIPTLLGWVKLPKDAVILEIGCGTGAMARHLSKKIPCKRYIGVDVDSLKIAKAETQTDRNTKIIFQVADISKLPFEDGTFDAVIELDVLHHVPDWRKAVREIHRVLKKNGKFLLRDYSIETFSFPALGILAQNVFDHPYNHMFDQVELLTYLRKNGFEVLEQNDSTLSILLAAAKSSSQGS